MPVLRGAAVFLQESALSKHDIHLSMIFLCIIAVALVAQAVGVLISGAFAAKLLAKVDGIADTVDKKTGPILDKTGALLVELTPKVTAISANVEQISNTVREQVEQLAATVTELNKTVQELNGRTRVQVARVDGMVTEALDTTEQVSQTVQKGIEAPVRQIVGVIAGLRVGLETLIERSPFGKRDVPGPYDL
jgi:methyl-accepting chemotaxis protein